jgi:allantoinase
MSSLLDLLVRRATVITPAGAVLADLGVVEGKIAVLGPELLHVSAREEIDATGALLTPGMIDAHVHFNEPGRTTWEGFATGTAAAAAGGVTTVIDMPLNSSPATLTPEAFHAKQARAAAAVVKTRLWGGLTPGSLDQLPALHACGVVGFKAFMSASGIEDFARSDHATLRAGMRIIAGLPGMCLAVHAEDEALTARLGGEARAAGRGTPRDFAASRPIEAELLAIREVLDLAGETGCPLHIVHISCAEGLALVAEAKTRGVDVTAETCPHYLLLTVDDLERLGALAKCAPPLRAAADREALWAALARGQVDTIGSDHSPCPPAMKAGPFAEAWGGISGVQHSVPLLHTEAAARGVPAPLLADLLSAAPGRRFHLGADAGLVRVGAPADLCLLSPAGGAPISRASLRDRHRHSPYVGRPLAWSVARTWVDGREVFRAGQSISE